MPRKAVVFGLFFMSLFIALQFAATNISSCQTINAPGEYVLNQSLNSSGTCIDITSGNVSLDCKGYEIKATASSDAISVSAINSNNTEVRNCVVSNAFRGVTLNSGYPNSVNRTITNITAYNNTYGVYLAGSYNVVISGITAYNNTKAIYLGSASNNTISNIIAYNNSIGISLYSSANANAVSNATLYGNTQGGIIVAGNPGQECYNNTFSNISIYDNPSLGINISLSRNTTWDSVNLSNNTYSISISNYNPTYPHFFTNSSINGRAVYSATNTQDIVLPSNLGLILILNSKNITVANQLLYGNGDGMIASNSSISMTNVTAYRNLNSGISLSTIFNSTVSNITAYNNSMYGASIAGANITASNITAYSNRYGISFDGGALSNSRAYGNNQTGISAPNTYGRTISDSIAYDNGGTGLSLFGTRNSNFSNISLYNNSYGVYATWGQSNNFSRLTIHDNSQIGMYMYFTSTGNSISNTNIHNNSQDGVYLTSDSTGNSFINTSVFSNNKSGGAYYDFHDLDSNTNNTCLLCGTSSPEGRCNSSCPLSSNPPVIRSSRISPSPDAGTNDTLQGFCNATDAEGENVTYYYAWQLNGALNASGQAQNYTQGVETNVGNISPSSLAARQNWTLECIANDGTANSSALNSSTTSISDNAPAIRSSRISPSPNATSSSMLQGFCNATDADGDNVSYYYAWRLNGAANRSGQSSPYSQGAEANVDNISSSSLAAGQNWILECKASDGTLNSSALNSSATLITRPVLAQLAMKVRNHMLRAVVIFAVSLDGEFVTFDPPVSFAPAEAKIITLDLATPACAPPSYIATFNNVTFYYSEGLLSDLTMTGHVPLVLRCR